MKIITQYKKQMLAGDNGCEDRSAGTRPLVFNQVSAAHVYFPVNISGPDLHTTSPASMNCLTDTLKSTGTYSANTQSVYYI